MTRNRRVIFAPVILGEWSVLYVAHYATEEELLEVVLL
jgi:hypothetical protein